MCWTPPAAPAQGALGNKVQELLNTVLMKAPDWQLRNSHGLFPELWQHKLWQQIPLPTSALLKTHALPAKSQAACPSHGCKETDDTAGLLVCWHISVTLVGFDNVDTLQIKKGLDSYQNSSHQSQNSCHKETTLDLLWPGLKCQQHPIKSILQ